MPQGLGSLLKASYADRHHLKGSTGAFSAVSLSLAESARSRTIVASQGIRPMRRLRLPLITRLPQ